MNLNPRISELEWVYENMNEFLADEEDLGETDIVNRVEPLVEQLKLTINAMKKDAKKEE